MTYDQCDHSLFELCLTADMNQRYHHALAKRWSRIDKSLRVVMTIVAVVQLVATLDHWISSHAAQTCLNLLAVSIAIALAIIPLGNQELEHSALRQRWTDLRKVAERLRVRTRSEAPSKNAPSELASRTQELVETSHGIYADEPEPNRRFLKQCQGDAIEAIYGPGIRTAEQADLKNRAKTIDPAGQAMDLAEGMVEEGPTSAQVVAAEAGEDEVGDLT